MERASKVANIKNERDKLEVDRQKIMIELEKLKKRQAGGNNDRVMSGKSFRSN